MGGSLLLEPVLNDCCDCALRPARSAGTAGRTGHSARTIDRSYISAIRWPTLTITSFNSLVGLKSMNLTSWSTIAV